VLSVFAVVSAILAYIQFKTAATYAGSSAAHHPGELAIRLFCDDAGGNLAVRDPAGTAVSPLRKLMRDWGRWNGAVLIEAGACVFARARVTA
jgi:hypothetical protein